MLTFVRFSTTLRLNNKYILHERWHRQWRKCVRM